MEIPLKSLPKIPIKSLRKSAEGPGRRPARFLLRPCGGQPTGEAPAGAAEAPVTAPESGKGRAAAVESKTGAKEFQKKLRPKLRVALTKGKEIPGGSPLSRHPGAPAADLRRTWAGQASGAAGPCGGSGAREAPLPEAGRRIAMKPKFRRRLRKAADVPDAGAGRI